MLFASTCRSLAQGPLCGPSRLSLECLVRSSLSTSAPVLGRTPRKYPSKLPKRQRAKYQNATHGHESGQIRLKGPKRVVAYLTQKTFIEEDGKRTLLGNKGDTALVTAAIMRNHLVPQGKAYYIRKGKPVVWPTPFADWVPPDVADTRLQARRDRQVLRGHEYLPKVAEPYNFYRAVRQKMIALNTTIEQNRRAAITRAYAGGRTRAERANSEGVADPTADDDMAAAVPSGTRPGRKQRQGGAGRGPTV